MNLFISTILAIFWLCIAPSLLAKTHSDPHLRKGSKSYELLSKETNRDSSLPQFQTPQLQMIARNVNFKNDFVNLPVEETNYPEEPNYPRNNLHLNQPRETNPQPIHCVDENNRPVDWVIFYKLPRIHGSPNPLIVNGEAYMSVSSDDVKRFEKKKNSVKDKINDNNKNEIITHEKNEEVTKDVDELVKKVDSPLLNESYSKKSNAKEIYDEKVVKNKTKIDSKKFVQKQNNKEQIDIRREHFPYYSYSNDDVTNDDISKDEQKNLMDKLKLVLMKQFVKDAREQIHMEKDAAKEEIEKQAKLLTSELDGGRKKVKRDTENVESDMENVIGDTENVDYAWNREREDMYKDFDAEGNSESPHLELDFSDSIRVLNNLVKARTLRDKKHAINTPNVDVRNGELKRKDFFEIFRAIELLNDNSGNDYSEETVGYDSSDETDDLHDQHISTHVDATNNDENFDEQSEKKYEKTPAKSDYPEQTQSDGVNLHWTLSKYSVRDPASLPGRILSPFLFNESYAPEFSQDGVKILYNDQTPTSTTVKFGHSKGLVLGSSDGGIWIVHSVPHFVDDAQTDYSYPHTGLMYGQNFLCLSLNRTELNDIGNNLGHNQVYKYSTHISDSNKPLYPTLRAVIDGIYSTNGENYYRSTIHTRFESVPFRTFAKTRELGEDLYANIARDLSTSLLVETWPNGPGRLHSDCKQPGRLVENVEGINASVVAFASTHDHAKWTISFRSDIGGAPKIVKDKRKEQKGEISSETSDRGNGQLGSNTETIIEETLQNKSEEDVLKVTHDDANQLSNEIDPIPHSSPEITDELNTELSDADEGASHDDSSMGEMELIAHRLLNRRYDLDGNMNNLDTIDDDAVGKKTDESAEIMEANEENSLSDVGSMEEFIAKTVEAATVERHRRSVSEMDRLDPLMFDDEFNAFNVPLHEVVDITSDKVGYTSELNGKAFDYNGKIEDTVADLNPTGNPVVPGVVEDAGHFVCNGDINRAEDQLKRGGGSVCIDNEVLWGLYHSLISNVEPCSQD